MTGEVSHRILLMGLPAAGKTTFLAVFWYALDMGASTSDWKLAGVHGNQEYLNRIRDAWGKCESAERTHRGSPNLVSIRVLAGTGGTIELVLPDTSGEIFAEQWSNARCSREYFEFAERCKSILLFVNPNKVDEGLGIRPIVEAARAAGGPPAHYGEHTPRPWRPEFAGTQVQLVEMLQILQRNPFTSLQRQVAVVVSAWDMVEHLGQRPEEWLASRLPLLHQYLSANPDAFPRRVFGVSAQGGDFSTQRVQLLSYGRPSERVRVRDGAVTAHDITVPVRWLVETE
jgi:hypothetical protein